jgi:cytochrome c556
MTVVRTGLVVTFLLSVLIGGALTEQALESRTRRQAAMQRALINQRQNLRLSHRRLPSTAAGEFDLPYT